MKHPKMTERDPRLAQLDNHVGREIRLPRRFTDRLRVGRLVEAVGLLLVGAHEGKYPLVADIGVDFADRRGNLASCVYLLGEISLDQVERHAYRYAQPDAAGSPPSGPPADSPV
jgi:hypothetical protein